MWNRVTGETSGMPLDGHTDDVKSIAISLDGNLIVSSSLDKTIRVWDAMTGDAFSASAAEVRFSPVPSSFFPNFELF